MMNNLQVLIFLLSLNVFTTQYLLYDTNESSISKSVFDCLYAHLIDYDYYEDYRYRTIHQIVPYCRRLDQNDAPDDFSNISQSNINNIITFEQLYKQGVTSTQLLNWSASIDIAEKYEIKGADSTEIFYNCSSPWFGSKCQYRFENNVQATFHDIVRLQFFTRNTFGNAPITCLDWRMICDGKFDCINRMDEDNCQILETNECSSDTYRCHFGGQCIPLAFVRDGSNTVDCLDGTDEMHLFEARRYHFASSCFKIPTFACEERTGPYQRYFSCSDDGISDCYYGEDEADVHACHLNDSQRFICESESNKCLSLILVQNGNKDCKDGEDEMTENQRNMLKGIVPFSLICNHKNDQLLLKTNNINETNCQYWPCNNIYTQCDYVKHCIDGADELNCLIIKCESHDDEAHQTLLSNRFCFSLMVLMEDYLSCNILYIENTTYFNTTINSKPISIMEDDYSCLDVEKLCFKYNPEFGTPGVFLVDPSMFATSAAIKYWLLQIEKYICPITRKSFHRFETTEWTFKSLQLGYFPPNITKVPKRNSSIINKELLINTESNHIKMWYCNRGIRILFNDKNTTKCLCPPSYFGNQCQWQNQRISLTIQLIYRTNMYITTVFQVIVMLIDEQNRNVSYYEQFTFVPKRDCSSKYNFYLLYPNQPKNSSMNYSIHIDLFDKMKLIYLGSWHLSIPFQFLPVNRIATQLFIPNSKIILKLCPLFCGKHGQCVPYINKNLSYFCQCNEGYSSQQCNIQQNCSCSLDSYCLRSSICICPLHKFGSKCYLNNSICQIPKNPCENNGICIPHDDRIGLNTFTCLCTENFFGTRCENLKNQIDIAFNDKNIGMMSMIWIPFITSIENGGHQRNTLLKKIKFAQNIISVFTIDPFHAIFIELTNQTYYLVVLREKFIESEYIQTKILPNYRCSSINELMNNTFLNYSLFHRVKYYPHLCQQKEQLKCFYDDIYICENICENNGLCFQDTLKCPLLSICVCPSCYYGTKCQFSTKGFALSLDYILSYNIKPNVSINRQPFIIQISISIATVMFILGMINAILSIITFQNKRIRKNGCSIYLLVSSWNSLCLIIILIIKFWQLILSQISIINNRLFLKWNCILLDVILKIFVASNDWFYGCIALERVFTVIKGIHFNQHQSKKIAKWICLFIYLLTIFTHIQDPFYRHLIDDIDIDEKRTWCLVQYSSALNIFNMSITILHFILPLSVNIISTILTIKHMAHSRWQTQNAIPFSTHLRQHFNKHKHHLFASCALILLALPRLIISFISGCMKSPRNPWLYLFGYFISFTPSMSTSIIFILPSEKYKNEFMTSIQYIIQHICIYFHIKTHKNN
ncbi:unnamed protein product [Rotaria sp. Silwood1]|nr:unnamed protein product [Rotaria sp. Silwood1]